MTAAPARWPELGLHLLRDRRFLWMISNIVMRMIIVTSTVIDFWMIMRIPCDPFGPLISKVCMGSGHADWDMGIQVFHLKTMQIDGFSQIIKGNFKEGRKWVG